nr:hypothetical protein [Hymenobacter terrenus]
MEHPPRRRPKASAAGVLFLPDGRFVGLDRGRIDEHPGVIGLLHGLKERFPHAGLGPAAKAPGHRVPGAKPLGQVTPGDARAYPIQNRIDKQPIITACAPTRAGAAQRVRFD